MITLSDYVGTWSNSIDWNGERQDNAINLLAAVNPFLAYYEAITGNKIIINRITNSQVSGEVYGGFRPQECPIGAPDSAHKQGLAVDVYDPDGKIDAYITDEILEEHGLYREAPESTLHWCHLTIRAPHSGNRTFIP